MARTKLVCTLGPASATPKMVMGLVRAGAANELPFAFLLTARLVIGVAIRWSRY